MKSNYLNKSAWGAMLAVTAISSAGLGQIPSITEPLDRSHKTELYGIGEYLHSDDIHTGHFNIEYNMINRRISPILTAGIGYQYLETELKNVPPTSYCWWDPWWGWICETSHPYASETDFTWNAGAGVRWNITDNLFVKALFGANWLEYANSKGITTQLEGIFSIGWTF